MTDFQKQIDQLEARANESELIAHLAGDEDTRDHNKRLALELRGAALRVRSRALTWLRSREAEAEEIEPGMAKQSILIDCQRLRTDASVTR